MQITKHVHALKIPFQITIAPGKTADRFVFVYIICGEDISLIDSGVAGSKKVIFDYLKKIGRKAEEISKLILTHSHPDHIGSARSIKEVTGCAVFIHAAEKPWVEDTDLQFKERPVPGFSSFVEGNTAVDRIIKEGDVISLDHKLSLQVFHTPGHSKGSTSFLLRPDNVLFCGDAVILPGQMPIFEDISGCMTSMHKLRNIKQAEVLLSSWDGPRKAGEIPEVLEKSLGYLKEIETAVKEISSENRSQEPMELCRQAVGRLKLPEIAVNPLVSRAFQSILKQ